MKTQHDSIDTASDLRDLIAQTPEETETLRPAESIRIELDKADFAEMRLTLLALRDEITFCKDFNPKIQQEMIERADKILDKASWRNVKYIF